MWERARTNHALPRFDASFKGGTRSSPRSGRIDFSQSEAAASENGTKRMTDSSEPSAVWLMRAERDALDTSNEENNESLIVRKLIFCCFRFRLAIFRPAGTSAFSRAFERAGSYGPSSRD